MRMSLIITAMLLFLAGNAAQGAEISLVAQGQWGKETNQIGIRFPSPGVMPVAPYQCVGGYDVDDSGRLWLTDSVNRMLKSYKNKEWSYIMTSFDKMGDISCFEKKLYIVTRSPDGVAVINPENGKVEQQLRIDFNNPGRIRLFAAGIIGVEEPGVGLWIVRDGKAELHPAISLEAVGDSKTVYGLQYNFEAGSRTIVSAELATQPQEPETIALFEAGDNIVFCKMAGMLGKRPAFMIVTQAKPEVLAIYQLNPQQQPLKRAELPVFEAPFLTSSWKLCSDGRFYAFEGTATGGFKIHRYDDKM
ncbi:MAG: hypothetical protein CVV42_20280 [Candidatus Riflebacteria bacterium HGW-Riflebacteria-2]|jgi:hypothetical protein|nr:MAG: hypothetical protein CVV42_20280 [Candidatus Riflebacteria bacterium HGW-Riflebacteria-2]